ncbi:unnamed protein product [Nippostrongylus brasiliensis]|uniref:Dynein light chain n=1 Tax=Nippostrongylus brasiliensis TaxID=27835 RepID=A0A0N4YNN2_NIPBR|nr:unnamed protein product [Nippostrongylus brasiliensis]
MKLSEEETMHMMAVLEGILNGSTDELTSNEAADFRFFVQKLQIFAKYNFSGDRVLLAVETSCERVLIALWSDRILLIFSRHHRLLLNAG